MVCIRAVVNDTKKYLVSGQVQMFRTATSVTRGFVAVVKQTSRAIHTSQLRMAPIQVSIPIIPFLNYIIAGIIDILLH